MSGMGVSSVVEVGVVEDWCRESGSEFRLASMGLVPGGEEPLLDLVRMAMPGVGVTPLTEK